MFVVFLNPNFLALAPTSLQPNKSFLSCPCKNSVLWRSSSDIGTYDTLIYLSHVELPIYFYLSILEGIIIHLKKLLMISACKWKSSSLLIVFIRTLELEQFILFCYGLANFKFGGLVTRRLTQHFYSFHAPLPCLSFTFSIDFITKTRIFKNVKY